LKKFSILHSVDDDYKKRLSRLICMQFVFTCISSFFNRQATFPNHSSVYVDNQSSWVTAALVAALVVWIRYKIVVEIHVAAVHAVVVKLSNCE
jgi:small basic protein